MISGSPVGLLAGAGAWALADRSIERAAFEAERDRALALLAEVEASRQTQLEAAAAEERNRIAREMHDVLAHSLAGLSMQLQAIRAVAAAEGASTSITGPIDRAAELAREGVQEARAAVGALRAPKQYGLDDLQDLVAGFPGQADLRVSGQPQRLSPDAGHAIYRAVQEAMTNTARYATGSAIDVEVTWGPAQLRVRVRDHGLPDGSSALGGQGKRHRNREHGRPGRGRRRKADGRTYPERLRLAGPGNRSRGRRTRQRGGRVTIRVLVADDQAVVRQGVVLLLSTSADIEVAGEASDGQEALRLALDLKPDVALVDLRMPSWTARR